jgi:thiol:disulfide interchange protein DsbA
MTGAVIMLSRLVRFFAIAVAVSMLGVAAAPAQSLSDKEYRVLPAQQPTDTPDKVEVLEFFQYSCGHCYDLEPNLSAWKKRAPKDVAFRYVPTVWDESRKPQARLFYTLEALGLLDSLHDKVYEAIHERQLKLYSDRAALDRWVAAQPGLDAKKFAETYDSFGVNNKVERAAQLTRNYRITGTPTVIVNGKYATGPANAVVGNSVDYARFAKILDELIARERKERK